MHSSHRYRHASWISWFVFLLVSVIMVGVLWCGWQVWNGRSITKVLNPINASKSTLTIGLRTAPESLDIRKHDSDAIEQALLGNVYETLITRGQDNSLQPGLAKSWSVSQDGLRYRFELRSAVRFTNGEVMDANSVLQSLKQGIINKYPGYAEMNNISSVNKVNSQVIEIVLAKPDALLLRRLAGRAGIVYSTRDFIDYDNGGVGTGPFTIERYDQAKSLVLTRNDSYWNGPSGCASITLRYFASDKALADAMQNGEIQMAVPQEGTENKRLSAITDVKVTEGKSTQVRFIAFNNRVSSIFCDRQVRKASRFAMSAQTAADADPQAGALQGGPIDPLSAGYEDLSGLFAHNPGQARSMFSYYGASYLGAITFLVPVGQRAVGEQLAAQLNAVSGFRVNIEEVDANTMQQRVTQGKYDMALLTMTRTLDEGLFGQPGSAYAVEDAQAQQHLAKAVRSPNAQGFSESVRQYARDVSASAAAHWLYVRKSVVAVRSNIKNYPQHMTDQLLPLHDIQVS